MGRSPARYYLEIRLDRARQRADEAGRRYPNLVDNMWASSHLAKDGSPKS